VDAIVGLLPAPTGSDPAGNGPPSSLALLWRAHAEAAVLNHCMAEMPSLSLALVALLLSVLEADPAGEGADDCHRPAELLAWTRELGGWRAFVRDLEGAVATARRRRGRRFSSAWTTPPPPPSPVIVGDVDGVRSGQGGGAPKFAVATAHRESEINGGAIGRRIRTQSTTPSTRMHGCRGDGYGICGPRCIRYLHLSC
jgi:hypothetical protein